MTARGYKFFAWSFLGFGLVALLSDPASGNVYVLVGVSFICNAASDILKAVSK